MLWDLCWNALRKKLGGWMARDRGIAQVLGSCLLIPEDLCTVPSAGANDNGSKRDALGMISGGPFGVDEKGGSLCLDADEGH